MRLEVLAVRVVLGCAALQGTIDWSENRKRRRAAQAAGGQWLNPRDLGPGANWQVRPLGLDWV